MPENKLHAIVLAAGKGTRMKSAMAKVLHQVLFVPMIHHVMDSLAELGTSTMVVTGHQADKVEEALAAYNTVFVRQEKQLGTGHAVLTTERLLAGKTGTLIILCGDTPLIRPQTLQEMLALHAAGANALTVMTTILDDPTNYGRIVSTASGEVVKIIEEKDASVEERLIKEVNAGIYCVDLEILFPALKEVGANNAQGELYLTDIVEIVRNSGSKVGKFVCPDYRETIGVNSRLELAEANKIMQERINQRFMRSGVSLVSPGSIFIEKGVVVGSDTTIQGNCYLTGSTVVGKGCEIGPFCVLKDCRIADGVKVNSFSDLLDREMTCSN